MFFAIVLFFFIIYLILWISNKNKKMPIENKITKQKTLKLLQEIKKRIRILIQYCYRLHPTNPNVIRLKNRFNPENIMETAHTNTSTSFTVNKGEEIHMCLRSKETFKHHDINILMFVAIHELAHVMSESYGHTDEFKTNFTWLLKKSTNCGVYQPVNYKTHPEKFCGLEVTNTPLF